MRPLLPSTFVRDLAHELSTPLTPIAGYLRLLQAGKLGALTPEQKRVVDAISHSVTRLTRIVDNLADFGSLESDAPALLSAAVDPDALADEVVAEQRGAIKEARLHVEVRHGGGGAVLADARKLRQAFANLVSNAVKFSPHGADVLVEVTREAGRLRFTVYDQGGGIPPGEAERVFEPLRHSAVKRSDDARAPGSGLGLPVARRIAEAHGGSVSLESPPRTQPDASTRHYSGSKFVLDIPVQPADLAAAGAGGPPASASARP
jgi:signal transduction histidine kinase